MNLWIGVALLLLGVSSSKGCGNKPFSSRVVNGENASPHSWPWQISLRVNGRHICGGSLIKDDWVVTAAHCVDRNPRPSGYTVVVGAHRRTGSTSVQQTFRLKQLFKHEGFSMRHLKNDIALLQLEQPIAASDKVSTVCLPDSGSQVAAGTQCYITGWGRTVGGGNAADTLQQAMLPVAEHSACSSVNGKLAPVDKTSMVCAGGQGKGGCQGDSGGPFVCDEGGKFVLRGAEAEVEAAAAAEAVGEEVAEAAENVLTVLRCAHESLVGIVRYPRSKQNARRNVEHAEAVAVVEVSVLTEVHTVHSSQSNAQTS
ncbi:hypothetical protein ACROYT_G023128 [Oculina patagonica]